MYVQDLLQEKGKDIYRSKGILNVHGYSSPFAFQGVHETFSLGPVTAPHSDTIINTFVFIGVNLDKSAIQEVRLLHTLLCVCMCVCVFVLFCSCFFLAARISHSTVCSTVVFLLLIFASSHIGSRPATDEQADSAEQCR